MRRNQTKTITSILAVIATVGILPTMASAQNGRWGRQEREKVRQEAQNRQKTKNDWRNLSIAGAAVAGLGLLKHDPTITFVGAAGSLYSLNRYEQDRKSQSKESQARADLFSRSSFERDGHRYERRETTRNGQRYYYFARR